MQIIPIHAPLLKEGDDLVDIVQSHADIQNGDILVVSSKAVATVEGALMSLSKLNVSDEAKLWSEKSGRSASFCEAVIQETTRLNGAIVSHSPHVLLTELKPHGFPNGVLLVPNAGLDESNVPDGYAIGWPKDPVSSAKNLRSQLNKSIAVIISDSCCTPRRLGVTAFALTVSGIDPFRDEKGATDLFGKQMQVTMEATADQLATAANAVMGNTAQSIPAAIIRGHDIALSNYTGWVEGIDPEQDVFRISFLH